MEVSESDTVDFRTVMLTRSRNEGSDMARSQDSRPTSEWDIKKKTGPQRQKSQQTSVSHASKI